MAKVDLNFTLDYCKRWGLREAVREVVQNARDVEILGGSFRVEHAKDTLTVVSEGQHLTGSALVFGASSKSDDHRTIGQFGDGLKVALGVFLRYNVSVRINTGREIWTPVVILRDGVRCVGVNTRCLPVSSHRERVTFEIAGVTAADWAEWSKMFLFLTSNVGDHVTTDEGTLLLDPSHKGAIYSKGIMVHRSTDLDFGYDLPHLSLNRDREIADTYEVRWGTLNVWNKAIGGPRRGDLLKVMYGSLTSSASDDFDNLAYNSHTFSSDGLSALADAFRADHGDAIVVTNSSAAAQAAQLGETAVVVSQALAGALKAAGVRDLSKAKASVSDAHTPVELSDLTAREYDRWTQALDLFAAAVSTHMPVAHVVDFKDAGTLGIYRPASDEVLISRNTLLSPSLYSTLAHEIAHRCGPDGSAEHRREIEHLMGTVIEGLLK